MNCDTCEAEEVTFIVGNAATGDQQFLGVACFARFGLEIAKAVLPAEEISAQLGPMFVKPTEEAPPTPQDAPGRSKRQKATPDTTKAERPAARPPEESAAGAD